MGGLQQCFVNLCFSFPSLSGKTCGGFSCKGGSTPVLPQPPRTPWAVARLCAAAALSTGDSHSLGLPQPGSSLTAVLGAPVPPGHSAISLACNKQPCVSSTLSLCPWLPSQPHASRRDFKCKKTLWVFFFKGFLSSHLSLFQST